MYIVVIGNPLISFSALGAVSCRVLQPSLLPAVRGLHGVHQVLGVVLIRIVLRGRLLHVRGIVAGHVGGERRERGRLADRADRRRGHQVAEPEAVEVGVPTEPQHGQHGWQRHDGDHQHLLDDHDGHQYGHEQRLDHQELERGHQREQQRELLVRVLGTTCN